MIRTIIAISIGASLGALLRWRLGIMLNHVLVFIPLGTLTANLVGGYLIGIALALFTLLPDVPEEVRLFVITGFLGALTTFSAFSAEVLLLLQGQRPVLGLVAIALHVLGSLGMTFLGAATVTLFKKL